MTDPIITEILTVGLTASLAMVAGAYFFKNIGKRAVVIPIGSHRIVKKQTAFIAFLISIFMVGWFSTWVEPAIRNFIVQNEANFVIGVGLPLLVLWFIFDRLNYQ